MSFCDETDDLEQALEDLIFWAEDKGYTVSVESGTPPCICLKSKLIELNADESIERQLYALLHECGHVLIYQNGFTEEHKIFNDDELKTPKAKVVTIIEEIEAWKRGLALARRFGIDVDLQKWNNEKYAALYSYIQWAAKENE